ncbi:TonB-dependent receptor [Prevotella sp. HJM029]|uniref:SusC/RagA family TonB-linked outer membrane protein n=1 Tax=Prevotella sp. HJM029 TaxID=1433844 RepID=UPI0004B00F12|nr:TonB-dependent receptor [Prevotella sp. HJM029]
MMHRSLSALLLMAPLGMLASPLGSYRVTNVNYSVAAEQQTVGSVLSFIEKNSQYVFLYNADVQKLLQRKVSITLGNRSMSDILNDLCKAVGLSSHTSGNQITLTTTTSTATAKTGRRAISGKVTDATGEPIIGATISEKGGRNGTTTNVNGEFSLEVNPENMLTISYVGFAPQTVKARDAMHITLAEESKGLDEVVVIGYGTKKKANLIGAVSTVTADELKDRPVSSAGQMLQGQVPNLNISFSSGTPGESTKMNIRGATSIVNSGAPLVLIDGVEGDLDRVNPNDIESISVLKDAASAAIYGARAGFGVIIVTTKSNKDGQAHITYNGRFSWSAPTTKTKFMTNGYQTAKLVDTFFNATSGGSYSKLTPDDYNELEARQYDTTENPARPWVVVSPIDGRYHYYGNFDWYNYLFDFTQPTWNHNLSISGGNNKMNYMLSGGMNDHDGVFALSTDKYRTRNLMAKFNAEVTSWFRIFSSASLFKSKYTQPGYDFEDGGNVGNLTFHAMPWIVPVNPDGTNVYTLPNSGDRPADGFAAMLRTGNGFSTVNKTEHTYAVGGVLKLMEGLELTGKMTYRTFIKDKLFRMASFQYSERPNEMKTANSGFFGNRLKDSRATTDVYVYDLYGNYHKTFAEAHNLAIMAGMNYERGSYKWVEPSGKDLLSETLNDLNLSVGAKSVKGAQHEYALLGYFGRISYDYLGKYMAEVNMRYDGTSRFKSSDRWGFFPSVALGWRVSEEKFFHNLLPVVSNLKLRASIGSLGNQVTDGYSNPYYPYIRLITLDNMTKLNYIFNNAQAMYATIGSPVSGSLTWEKVVTSNAGLDVGLLNNRLALTLDVYQRNTKDMLATSLTLPAVYGYAVPLENNGELRTRGFELSLSWNDKFLLAGKPFYYGITASLADSKSKLTKFRGNETKILGQNYEGMEWGEIWGYKVQGIYQTNAEVAARGVDQSFLGSKFSDQAGDLIFEDLDGNHKINNGKGTLSDHGDLVKLGNSQARYHYGFSLNLSWYGFDMSMFWQGIGRQNMYPGDNNMMFWGPYSRAYSSFIPADLPGKVWSENNRDAYFPRAGQDQARWFAMSKVNDRYLQNLAYCRLKNLTIGYTLPKILTKKIYLDKVRFYFSGENLFTMTKLKSDYLDPEQMTTDRNGRVYPFSKTFSFGVDVSF